MKKHIPASFEDLIKTYYGDSGLLDQSNTAKMQELLANYYGQTGDDRQIQSYGQTDAECQLQTYGQPYRPPSTQKVKKHNSAVVRSLSYDDGEILTQANSEQQNRDRFEEYVVQQSIADADFEEYVVEKEPWVQANSVSYPQTDTTSEREASTLEEYQVDLFQPWKSPIDSEPRDIAFQPSPIANSSPDTAPADVVAPEPPSPAVKAELPELPLASQSLSAHQTSPQPAMTEDDLIADLQSILTGQKVFDPVSKKTIGKDELDQPRSHSGQPPAAQQPSLNPSANNVPFPEVNNGQAIFDRIAQSMQYANAYDLGTVELENRFSDFDRMHELEQKAAAEKKASKHQPPVEQSSPAATVDSVDFLQDLDTINKQRSVASSAFNQSPSSPGLMTDKDYSRPFYDTGEHVLAGGNLYKDQLRVGKEPGVYFSYGQIIAMADLYESVDQMMAAEVRELQQIKTLIERSTAYYSTNKIDKSKDVSHLEWETATRERYLQLAENNYEHFSPNTLFKNSALAKLAHGDNKSAWENHHKQAIVAAQQLGLDHPNSTPFPEWPLIINAFGDHFLTDAFAAGHVINKEVMIKLFKANFFNGNSLTSEGEAFFGNVAKLAFKGEVKKKFSVLETYEPVILWWNPNIDTENAFRKLLIKAAEQQPDSVANLVVKALHDRLNQDGIEVFNNAGDGTWQLTGDGTLNPKNLEIIQKAVQQSVNNINDPSIYSSNLNFEAYFAKVWKYVPQLTAASQSQITQLIKDYTSPHSTSLPMAAAQLIHDQVDSLIKKLLQEKKLKYA